MEPILYLHRDPSFAGFIADDLQILSERYTVRDISMAYGVRDFAGLARAIQGCRLVYAWWGDVTGVSGVLGAALWSRRSVLVTGGYDVADVPSIRYGLRYHRLRGALPRIALSQATRVIANSENGAREATSVCPDVLSRLVVIPHAVRPRPCGDSVSPRLKQVLTVSIISDTYIPYKGLDTFVRAARLLPDVQFVHAGPVKSRSAAEYLQRIAPPNVRFAGFLSGDALGRLMAESAVYAQLSAHEGFGMALAEAMLAGATPVCTKAGAIPEVAGDIAYYVPYGDPVATSAAVVRALANPTGEMASRRIASLYSYERRRNAILDLVGTIV